MDRVVGGRYALGGELGRGGMGVVWRASDQVIGREVAVKELRLPPGVPATERTMLAERVLREARTAGKLNHPGIVTVHDVVIENDVPFIVMELVSAPTLADLVAANGPLRPDQVADLLTQLLSALECAHAAGIVHRDVKPSNIMVLPNGQAKLADFGIAQAVDDPAITATGTVVGSPAFISPERIHGTAATPASDLWSLGATAFFAVEGWSPFDRQTTPATLHAILNEAPRFVRCSGPLQSAITGLLSADPVARLTPPQVRALLQPETRLDLHPPVQRENGGRTSAIVAVVLSALAVLGAFAGFLYVRLFPNGGSDFYLTVVVGTGARGATVAVLTASCVVLTTAIRQRSSAGLAFAFSAGIGLISGIAYAVVITFYATDSVLILTHTLVMLLCATIGGLAGLLRPARTAAAGVLVAAIVTISLVMLSWIAPTLVTPALGPYDQVLLIAGYRASMVDLYVGLAVNALVSAIAVPIAVWPLVRSGAQVRAGLLVGVLAGVLRLGPAVVGILPPVIVALRDSAAKMSAGILMSAVDVVGIGLAVFVVSTVVGALVAVIARSSTS